MNTRSTLLMFALSIGALWLFGLMLAYKRTNVEEGLILPSLKKVPDADIESLSLQYKEESRTQDLDFYQHEGGWTFGQNKIRVESHSIKKILEDLRTAAKNDEERVPANNGTDSPRIIVTIKAKNRKDIQLKVGNATNDKNFDFVKTSELTQAVAVAHSQIADLFFADINKFRSHKPFDFAEINVKRIDVKQAGDAAKKEAAKELEIKRTDDDLWKVLLPKDIGYASAEGVKKDQEKDKDKDKDKKFKLPEKEEAGGVSALLGSIKGLQIDDEDFVKEINLAGQGLSDGEERWRIVIGTGAGLGKEEAKETILLIGNKVPDKDKYFARMAGDLGVFKLSGKSLEPIFKAVNNSDDLRSRDIVFTSVEKFDLVRIKDKKEYLLSHPAGAPWSMFADGKWVKANDSAASKLLEALARKGAILDFPKLTDLELGLDQPRMTLFLTADAKPKEEKKPEAKKEEKKDEGKKEEGKKDENKKDDKAKAEEKFVLDVEPGVLERKDWSTEATFKTKAASVSPVDDKQTLVKAEVVDGKVKFTQIGDADKEDKTVDFKVLGGKDGKEDVVVKVTVRRKPNVTLIFGKLQSKKFNDKEVWSVKRILDDGKDVIEHRFYLAKDLVDKIIPSDVYLAFLNNALPVIDDDDVTNFALDRNFDKTKEKLELLRTKADAWFFNNPSALPTENVAETSKVLSEIARLGRMSAVKWVQEIDAKTDLKQFGLDQPQLTAVLVVKKVQPLTAVSAVAMLGSGAGLDMAVLAGGESVKDWCNDDKGQTLEKLTWPGTTEPLVKVQTVTIRFGKEGDKDGETGFYALFTVEGDKDAKKTNDLLFLANKGMVEQLKKIQFHDRSTVLRKTESIMLVSELAAGPYVFVARQLHPFTMLKFDASKVNKISIETRGLEKRTFVFVRDKKAGADDFGIEGNLPAELPKFSKEADKNVLTLKVRNGKVDPAIEIEPKDYSGVTVEGKDDWIKITVTDKAKDGDSFAVKVKALGEMKSFELKGKFPQLDTEKSDPVRLKGQTWKDASPAVFEFHVDSEKVNSLVERLSRMDARALASFDGPRAYQKLGPNDAAVIIKIDVDGAKSPLTLSIGAKLGTGNDRFAYVSTDEKNSNLTVYLIGSELVDLLLGGTATFGKEPTAQ